MFRLSDLNNKDQSPHPPTPTPPPVPPASSHIIDTPKTPPPPHVSPPSTNELERVYGRLYEELVSCVTVLFEQARQNTPLDLTEARRLVTQLPAMNTHERGTLMGLLERHSQGSYLYTHAVNVAMLAAHLGHCLGHPEELVYELALAGLLLDIGMAGEGEHIASLPRKLTAEEWSVIAKHPAKALEHLKTVQDLPQSVLDAIGTHHKRPDGRGYPAGAEGEVLDDFGKILAVCDVYDALTHPRSYRNRLSPAQAIKVLVDGVNTQFGRRVIKALVDALSLYPRGSVVRLSTNEIARVKLVHPEAPLRPVVLITRNANQAPLLTPRQVDLIEQPFVYIKEVVADEDA